MASAWGRGMLPKAQPGMVGAGDRHRDRHQASAGWRKPELFTFLITGTKASAQPGVIPTDKVNRM